MNNERAKSVDIVFGAGVRQDLNPQTAPAGTLVACDNLEFDQLGRLVRRDGFVTLGQSRASKTATIGAGPIRRFAQGPDGARLIFTDQNAFLYVPTLDKVCEAGLDNMRSTIRGSLVDVTGIVADDTGDILFADACSVSNWAVYVYIAAVPSSFAVCVDVIDLTSGARVMSRQVLASSAGNIQPRLVRCTGTQIVFAIWQATAANTIQYAKCDFGASPLHWTAAATLVADADFPPIFDADSTSGGWGFVYRQSSAGSRAVVKTYDSSPTVVNSFTWKASAGASDWSPTSLAICGDALASSKVHVAGYDPTAFRVETQVLSSALAAVANSQFNPGLDHAKPATQMALGRRDATNAQLCFSNYTSATFSTNPRGHLHCYAVPNTAIIALDLQFANYTLGSKFYRDARNGGLFAMARFDDPSGFQSHYLLLDFGTTTGGYGAPVPQLHVASGRVRLRTDNAFTGIGGMADMAAVRPGLFQFVANMNSGAAQISGGQVNAYTLESIGARRFLSTPCQLEAVVGGATPLSYDGQRLVELGFYSYPVVAVGNFVPANVGGFLSQGLYQYRLIYEWTDARGNRHQSPASPAVTVDLSGVSFAASTNQVSITVPAYHATRKQVQFPVGGTADAGAPIRIIVYRTRVNGSGSTFYRLAGGPSNNTASAADDTVFVDGNIDGVVAANEILYVAAGGQGSLATSAPPPSVCLTTHLQRLWGVDGESPETIWCTKVLSEGLSPGYNQALRISIPGAGRINGIGGQDGKIYALALNGIYLASYGDGPDNAGGGAFPSPQLITTSANCTEPRSVLVGMDGIYFVGTDQWGTGIYQIRRGDGGPVSIGKRVRTELAAYPVCRGAIDRVSKARAEFLFVDNDVTPTGGVILYYHHDYLDAEGLGQWTVARVLSAGALECLGMWDDVSVVADTTNVIGLQVLGTGRDFGATMPVVTITTADVRAFGLVGFGQIAGLTLLGTQVVTDPIKIEASYDSGFSWPDVFQYAASPESAGAPVLRRFEAPTQKQFAGGAVRLRITDPQLAAAPPGTTFFHGVSIETVPLGGNARLPTTQRA